MHFLENICIVPACPDPYVQKSGFYLLKGVGGSFPPPQKKSFPEKKFKAISNKDLFFDNDFKESVKVTNVQKCNFSQS